MRELLYAYSDGIATVRQNARIVFFYLNIWLGWRTSLSQCSIAGHATTYLSMFDQCLSVNQESLFPTQSLADSIHLVQAAQDDVKDYMQQRRQANKVAHLHQQTSEAAAGEAKAAAVAAGKAARAAAEKQVILKLVHSPALSNWRN